MLREGYPRCGQQGSQVCLSEQVTLDLQDQSPEVGAIARGHEPKLRVPVGRALFRTAHHRFGRISAFSIERRPSEPRPL
jgi:hypothetical protein